MALGPGLPIRMVWPSPFCRATSAVPMVPPAPERFSTTADCPQFACRCAANSRPITSVLPPAAAGTISRTVSVGRQSARLARGRIAAAETPAAAASTRRRDIGRVTVFLPVFEIVAGRVGNARAAGKRTTWRSCSRSPDAAQRVALAKRCAAEPGPLRSRCLVRSRLCAAALRAAARPGNESRLPKAQQLEQRRQVAELLAGGRRGAADEVEDLAVLQAVIGEPPHLALLVEIDRDHPLVDDLLVHERHLALTPLRNVIKHLAVEGGDSGGGSHHDQHLILAGADRNLLQRAGRQDVALLELLAGTGAKDHAQQRYRHRRAKGAPVHGDG